MPNYKEMFESKKTYIAEDGLGFAGAFHVLAFAIVAIATLTNGSESIIWKFCSLSSAITVVLLLIGAYCGKQDNGAYISSSKIDVCIEFTIFHMALTLMLLMCTPDFDNVGVPLTIFGIPSCSIFLYYCIGSVATISSALRDVAFASVAAFAVFMFDAYLAGESLLHLLISATLIICSAIGTYSIIRNHIFTLVISGIVSAVLLVISLFIYDSTYFASTGCMAIAFFGIIKLGLMIFVYRNYAMESKKELETIRDSNYLEKLQDDFVNMNNNHTLWVGGKIDGN